MSGFKDIVPAQYRALTVGALEMGQYVSSLILGGIILQVFHYYRNFPNDPLYVRTAVGVIMALLLALSALLQRFVWQYTIVTPCDPRGLDQVHITLSIGVPILGTVAVIVQTMYCMRVWRIVENAFVALFCWALALGRFAMFMFIAHISFTATSLHHETGSLRFQRALTGCLACGTAADVAICLSITFGLMRRRTGFAQTDALVDRVIAYTVGSGLLPSVVGVAELIAYLLAKDKLVWLAFWFIMGPALATSLIVSLTQRTSTARGSDRGYSANKPSSAGAVMSGGKYTFERPPAVSGIGVELTSVTRTDAYDHVYGKGGHNFEGDDVGHQPMKGHHVV